MKVLWCWRCGMDVPMLDEQEFEAVSSPTDVAKTKGHAA